MPIESTDSIKRRMIKNASRVWGYPDSQDINSFDPVVGMILGALADELNNISGEIQKTDSRVIQKLLDLLFNQSHLSHFPAYGIVQAAPIQARVKINDRNQFTYRKRIENSLAKNGKPEERNIHFTPSGDFNLFKGQVKVLASGDQLYQISGQIKEQIDLSGVSIIPDYGKLFIGLELDRNVEELDGLTLHFSLKNRPNEERFFRSIQDGKWFINGEELEFFQGLDSAQRKGANSLEELFRQESDVSYRACKFINDLFGKQFMTLAGSKITAKDLLKNSYLPPEIRNQYPEDIIKLFPDNLYWVTIELPQPVSADTIAELLPLMNCFPIINRGRNEFTQSLRKGTNVIPLESEDIYFDIRQIADSSGKKYTQSNNVSNDKSQKRTYIIRQGGMGRFDSRDAIETIDHLTDLVRNESAAFSILGTDMISSELKELDQIISRLRYRLENSSNTKGTNSYLLLKSELNNERAHVEFWTTSGELANNIRSGTKLSVYRGRDLSANSVFLLTNTKGGKQKLSEEDKLNKLRRAILSKGRIVTREDIKALCFDHFGKDIEKVEISNGVEAQSGAKTGLVQTLDIYVLLKKQHKLSAEDLSQKEEELKVLMKQGSINVVIYRLFIS